MKGIRGFVSAVRGALTRSCDVPNCDGTPEPLLVDGGIGCLCSDHTIEYLVLVSEREAPA